MLVEKVRESRKSGAEPTDAAAIRIRLLQVEKLLEEQARIKESPISL